jgi:hypothetical protein
VDVLALLSPIPLLDALFKAIRAVIFLLLGGLALIDSKVALVISVVITAICLLCVAWALRVAVFGAVFAWDTLRSIFLGYRSNPITDREVLGFTANRIGGLRKRCFGALRIAPDGSLEFVRKPLGFGFRKTVRLRPERYEVGRGFLFPCVLAPDFGGREYQFQFRLLPRYLGYEEEVRETLHLGRVRDLRVPSEFKAAWNWLHDTIQGEKAA